MEQQVKKDFNRRNIFIDLDETLISTLIEDFDFKEAPVAGIEYKTVKPDNDPSTYVSAMRPGANYLLYHLREIGQLYMVTRATAGYALAFNEAFSFAFPEDRIFSRKDVENCRGKYLNIPSGKNFLIDDLDRQDNYEKIKLISQLGPVKYIKVMPFYGFSAQAFTHSDITEIVNKIIVD